MGKNLLSILFLSLTFLSMALGSCDKHSNKNHPKEELPDTILVGTLYSPTSFFIYREDTLGYEYERICNFAADKGIGIKFLVAHNMQSMIEMLDSGKIDLIAYEIPITAEYQSKVLNCGQENITWQILVQPKSDSLITDVTQLIGKDIYVEKGSKYEARLINLDNEIGGGINIHTINRDSIITEDLIGMVADGELPLTVVDSDIARLNRTYYDNIDISLEISFPQRAAWAVAKDKKWLADSINEWSKIEKAKPEYKMVLKRYFEMSKIGITDDDTDVIKKINENLRHGIISDYDNLFKKHATLINWDWRILAAQAWVESRFKPNARSWAGATGLMQLMPRTARAYGLNDNEFTNPDKNIEAAVKSIKDLDKSLMKYVPDDNERIYFIIAAYNSGIGHIYDAIALAKKYGKDPSRWFGNVEDALLWKANPEYYNDDACRFGYFRGKQTVAYVKEVFKHYNIYKSKIKLD